MKLAMDQQDVFGRPMWRATTDDNQHESFGEDPLGAVTNLVKILENNLRQPKTRDLTRDELGRPLNGYFEGRAHAHAWGLVTAFRDGHRLWECRTVIPKALGFSQCQTTWITTD